MLKDWTTDIPGLLDDLGQWKARAEKAEAILETSLSGATAFLRTASATAKTLKADRDRRCTRVSPGCDNCWHLRMANRHAGNPTLPGRRRAAACGKGLPYIDERQLTMPVRNRDAAEWDDCRQLPKEVRK